MGTLVSAVRPANPYHVYLYEIFYCFHLGFGMTEVHDATAAEYDLGFSTLPQQMLEDLGKVHGEYGICDVVSCRSSRLPPQSL